MLRRTALISSLLIFAACGGASKPDDAAIQASKPAPLLSDYGFFSDISATIPAEGVIAYDLINPLFSDHAAKHRFVYLPAGTAAEWSDTEAFTFPVGAVLIKTFAFAPDMRTPEADAYNVETRILIHKADGWEAIPYVWNADRTDAVYAPTGKIMDIQFLDPHGVEQSIAYAVPNKNQCKTCHQSGDDVLPIGPKARHLNHEGPYGRNQLADWHTRNILNAVPAFTPQVASVADVKQPLEARARAYLDINCAHCHKPDGSASNSGLWLHTWVDEPVKIGIGKHPTAAGRGSGGRELVIQPGDPDASILSFRMASNEAGVAMPELGRVLSDDEGTALIEAWIASMDPAD